VEDGVGGFHHFGGGGGVFAGVEVAVEAGEVAAADFEADFVALEEDVAGGPHVDLVLVDFAGGDELGRGLGGFAILGAEDAFRHVAREAVRAYID